MITRRIFWITLLPVALTAVAGCAQAEKIDLKLALTKGQSFKLVLRASTSANAALAGKPVGAVETLTYGLQFSVTEVTAEGNYRLRATFDTPSYTVSATGFAGAETLDKALRGIAGQSFTVELDRKGLVISLSGLDSAAQGVARTLSSVPEPARGILEALINQALSDANWRQLLSGVFSLLPDGPVELGERWSRKLAATGQGINIQTDLYCKILERANGVAKIKVYYDIRSWDRALPIGVTYSLSGTSEGTVSIEEATGLILKGDLKSSLKGTAVAPDTQGKAVSLTVTGNSSITRS